MDVWYHGTDEYFCEWSGPPAKSKYKPELFPHQFISLSKDLTLAKGAGKITNGLCSATLSDSAKRLDLREKSSAAENIWHQIRQTELGCAYANLHTFDLFVAACNSGNVLRYQTVDEALKKKLNPLYEAETNLSLSFKQQQGAFLFWQNFTRQWIDAVISPARQMGYQAVVCAEIDRRDNGPVSCVNLYVFDPKVLSAPDWITKPDG